MTENHPLNLARQLALSGNPDGSEELLIPLAEQGDPRATFNLGWHHARHGRLLKAMEHLAYGRGLNVFGLPPIKTDKKIWRDEPLEGEKILFRGEGGYGDIFANLRFAQNFKDMGAHVTVSCPKDMFSLLRTIPYIDNLIDNDFPAAADHDYWVPAMSAIVPLKLEYEQLSGAAYIPNQKPLPLAGKTKIGLRWAGNPQFEDEQYRKFPSHHMSTLADIEGAHFYSLQRDIEVVEHPRLTNMEAFMTDWLATAKIISGLDLVITSCTSTAHLAGAMGIPTWIVVPVLPYYTWAMPGTKTAWYDSVSLYRQKVFGEWEQPFSEVRQDLEALLSGNILEKKAA